MSWWGGHLMRWASMARRVTVSLPDEMPVVDVDAGQIERALVNLLENAIKFSRPRRAFRCRSTPRAVKWSSPYRDEGVGLPPEDLLTIFEPFQRGSGGAERPGAGLGLAIVRGFAQANGGASWAESNGRGATFFLALPIVEAAVEIPT